MSSWFGASSNDTISWESEPKVRGTWTIISTCIVTIGLCVSKAIHLNIPDYKGAAQQKWLQLSWMLLGLLAPEMKRDAAALGQRLRSLLGESEKNSVTQDYPWTKTHSFYAIMGGFAFDTTSTGKHIMPGHHTRLTLTPRALQFLAKHDPHLIPNHTVEQIEDKSKADPMIKFVTCVQALWFCIQCIHRVAAGLAISLLELNTFAHSVCALLIYLLWWHKPLNIKEPTLVQGERMLEICAVMCLASELDGEAAEFDLFQYLPRFRDSDEAVLEKSVGIYRQTAEEQEGAKRIRFSPGQDSPDASDYTYLAFMGFTLAGALYGGLHLIAWDAPFSSASEKYLWRASGIILVSSGPGCALLLAIRTWYLRGIIEWRDEPLRNHDSFLVRTIVLGFQSWVGGGYYVTSGLLVTFFLLYMAARAYLVVECFINVANLPASVFEIPSWTQYVPHIT
ncbi:hypothetical protein K490DRAFT_43717 [Saccharata proteae CBS 121410]|uniref:Uncharacterized protein n=1 Tax=Saccharata proteae CBS 121410 TaxID=1314787 RepID=A0A9P4LWQ0_9PEZI|nr:hypothetical protein K490DRAFT_43717 [Saccharata proteae CBS 121410]